MMEFMSKELSEGNSFFIYQSDSVDSLSSCCRLRNELTDNTFSYTLGAGGIATGSINVITMNLNRIIQKEWNLEEQLQRIYKYHYAYRNILQDLIDKGMLPVYSAGFISLKKQFSTIGINGLVEAAESKGIKVGVNKQYAEFVNGILSTIYNSNKIAKKQYSCLFNTEMIPAENLGVKNAKWDLHDHLQVERDCYNSYFYKVEDDINIVDKFILHGKEYIKYLDGGSALHLNLGEYPSQEGYKKLLELAAKTGCNYFTTNVKITICNDCGNINKNTLNKCPKCGSANIDYATRIIGYLKRISSFSKDRQDEALKRFYHE
jgi:ribonucleoside-triphosphate reductase (formate)